MNEYLDWYTFSNRLSDQVASAPIETLRKMILTLAEFVDEAQYDIALRSLSVYTSKKQPGKRTADLLERVQDFCKSVNDPHRPMRVDYDDWTDGYTLQEDNGICAQAEAFLFKAMELSYAGDAATAVLVFDTLLNAEVYIEDWYDDTPTLTFLIDEGMIKISSKQIAQCYARCILLALRGLERVERLYLVMRRYALSLPDVLDTEIIIPESDSFWDAWIETLIDNRTNMWARKTLFESVLYRGGIDALATFAQEHAETVPETYAELVDQLQQSDRYADALQAARDGIRKVQHSNVDCMRLADRIAAIGQATNDTDVYTEGVLKGYASSGDLTHFLSLYHLPAQVRDAALSDARSELLTGAKCAPESQGDTYKNEQSIIRFLLGDFQASWLTCLSRKPTSGWSDAELPSLVPLFIALLNPVRSLSPCTLACFREQYALRDYAQGLADAWEHISSIEDRALWDDVYQNLPHIIAQHVYGIVSNQHRSQYDKAARLVGSLAETIARVDCVQAANAYMSEYYARYPRHYAFRRSIKETIELVNRGLNMGTPGTR